MHPHAAALAGGECLTTLGRRMLALILPAYVRTLGSSTVVGLLLASFGLAQVLSSLAAV